MQFKSVLIVVWMLLIGLATVTAQDDVFDIITPANAAQLELIQTIQLTDTHANQIAFNPMDSTQLAVGQGDGVVSIWDLNARKIVKTWDLGEISVVSMEYSIDGERLIAVLESGELFIWDTADWSHINSLAISGQAAQMIDVAQNDLLAVSYKEGPVRLWDSKTGEMLAQVQSYSREVAGIDLNPEGTALALGYVWGAVVTFNLIDIPKGDITLGFFHKTGELNDVALRPTSEYKQNQFETGIVSVSNFTGLEIWGALYGIEDFGSIVEMAYPSFVTFNKDGRLIAVAGKETAAGGGCNTERYLRCHVEFFYREAYGPGLYGSSITSEIVADLSGHEAWMTDINFSFDDRFFATSSYDQTIMIWGIPQP